MCRSLSSANRKRWSPRRESACSGGRICQHTGLPDFEDDFRVVTAPWHSNLSNLAKPGPHSLARVRFGSHLRREAAVRRQTGLRTSRCLPPRSLPIQSLTMGARRRSSSRIRPQMTHDHQAEIAQMLTAFRKRSGDLFQPTTPDDFMVYAKGTYGLLYKNAALLKLECSYNQLTNIDVTKNTLLTSLNCACNKLTSLDVNQNTVLGTLECSVNQLTNLDLSKLTTALGVLSCASNKLTNLDVSQNTKMWKLYVL